jgi:hypothetical protein
MATNPSSSNLALKIRHPPFVPAGENLPAEGGMGNSLFANGCGVRSGGAAVLGPGEREAQAGSNRGVTARGKLGKRRGFFSH